MQGTALTELHGAPTVEAALQQLRNRDPELASRLGQRLAAAIEQRSLDYLQRHGAPAPQLGAVLFDRQRQLCALGPVGAMLFSQLAGAP